MKATCFIIHWRSAASAVVCGLFLLLLPAGLAGATVDLAAVSPAEFAVRPEVLERIDPEHFHAALLNAAIFHETNRIRRAQALPAFTHLAKLDDAADLKAAVGVVQGDLDHLNPLPSTAQPADRVAAVGLKYRRVGENLARLTIYAVRPGTTEIGVRQRGLETEFFDVETREPVRANTYAGFATAVVEAWMHSPGHRANIVNRDYASLGIATRFCLSPLSRQPQIYAVQVFFTPR
jgi:uncharacterized protein YkwD